MSFVVPKMLWLALHPGNVYFALLCVGVGLLWTRRRGGGRRLLAATLAGGLLLAVLPTGPWLLAPLENRFPVVRRLPDRLDGIIVLGGAIDPVLTRARGQPAVGGGAERLFAFAELARRYPEAKLVYSGGSGYLFNQDAKESEGASRLFAALGLDPDRIVFENRSRNTYENAVMSRALVHPRPGEAWLLITSARHMPRAYGTFRKAGWRPIPYPVDFATDGRPGFALGFDFTGGLGGLRAGLKEWLGLWAYYLAGRTDSPFPGPEDSP